MQRLLEQISREHYPKAPATPQEIVEFEERVGWRLDEDLRAFFRHCNGAELFKRRPDCPYRLLSLSEVIRARIAMRGEDTDEAGPALLYTLCYRQDGNYVLVDVSRQNAAGRYPLIDGYHEAFPDPRYCRKIADSFAEFLAQALQSGGVSFWLGKEHEE